MLYTLILKFKTNNFPWQTTFLRFYIVLLYTLGIASTSVASPKVNFYFKSFKFLTGFNVQKLYQLVQFKSISFSILIELVFVLVKSTIPYLFFILEMCCYNISYTFDECRIIIRSCTSTNPLCSNLEIIRFINSSIDPTIESWFQI